MPAIVFYFALGLVLLLFGRRIMRGLGILFSIWYKWLEKVSGKQE